MCIANILEMPFFFGKNGAETAASIYTYRKTALVSKPKAGVAILARERFSAIGNASCILS